MICGLLLGGIKGIMTYKKQSDPEVRKETDLTYSADLELYEKNKDTYTREIENLRTDIEEPARVSRSFDLDQYEPV